MIRVAIVSECVSASGGTVLGTIRRSFPPEILSKLDFHEIPGDHVASSLDLLRSSEIVVADPPLISSHLDSLNALKWLQSTYAGSFPP